MDAIDPKLQAEIEAMHLVNAAIQRQIVRLIQRNQSELALVLAQVKLDLNRDFDRKRRDYDGIGMAQDSARR